jgi:hypothetical protein
VLECVRQRLRDRVLDPVDANRAQQRTPQARLNSSDERFEVLMITHA